MAVIKVIAKIGDTHHPKYGLLIKGQEYEIDESDFGDEIFERATESKTKKTGGSRRGDEVPHVPQKEE